MKLLLVDGTENFLVDLEAMKSLSVLEVVQAVGNDELVTADLNQLDRVNLETILSDALKPKSTPVQTSRTRTTTPKTDLPDYRGWYSSLDGDEKVKITPEGKTLNKVGAVPAWVREAYDKAH